jgi:hypothetical protein
MGQGRSTSFAKPQTFAQPIVLESPPVDLVDVPALARLRRAKRVTRFLRGAVLLDHGG